MTKICRKCGEEKDIDEFGMNKVKADKHSIYCKKCLCAFSKKYHPSGLTTPGRVLDTKIAVSDIVFQRNMRILVKAYKQTKRRGQFPHNFRFAFKAG